MLTNPLLSDKTCREVLVGPRANPSGIDGARSYRRVAGRAGDIVAVEHQRYRVRVSRGRYEPNPVIMRSVSPDYACFVLRSSRQNADSGAKTVVLASARSRELPAPSGGLRPSC